MHRSQTSLNISHRFEFGIMQHTHKFFSNETNELMYRFDGLIKQGISGDFKAE